MTTLEDVPDDHLTTIGMKFGDIIALRMFTRTQVDTVSTSGRNRTALVDRLRQKMSQKRSEKADKMFANKLAKKTHRRVELGWINYVNSVSGYKQVRPCKGGGIRHLVLSCTSKPPEILQSAKELFFPSGISPIGAADDFECKLVHVDQTDTGSELDVEALYSTRCVKILRLYMATKAISVSSNCIGV